MRKELEEAIMKKVAAAGSEAGSMFAWNLLPYIGAIGNGIGGGAGAVDNPATEADEAAWDENPNYHLGVGAYRLNRRLKRQLTDDKGGAKHYVAMNFGPWTSTLAATLAGGALGGLGGAIAKPNDDRVLGKGMQIGAAVGGGAALLANLIGPAAAAFTKRRTKEEQKAYANSSPLSEYFIPGKASYNMWKSVGRSIGDSEERAAKKKEQEAAAEKKEASAKVLVNGILAKYLNK